MSRFGTLALGAVVASLALTTLASAVVVTSPTSDIVGAAHDLTNFRSALNTNYPGPESPAQAIDGSTATKYLNFTGAGLNDAGEQVGNPTGFIVTLAAPSAINAFAMATANDFPSRDPGRITIEGTNRLGTSADIAANDSDLNWTLLYSGSTGIIVDQARNTFASTISFPTSAVYKSYRVIITDLVRYAGSAPTNSQFSEISLQLNPVPEPTTASLLALPAAAILRRRR